MTQSIVVLRMIAHAINENVLMTNGHASMTSGTGVVFTVTLAYDMVKIEYKKPNMKYKELYYLMSLHDFYKMLLFKA